MVSSPRPRMRLRRAVVLIATAALSVGLLPLGAATAHADDPTVAVTGILQDSSGNPIQYGEVDAYGSDPDTPVASTLNIDSSGRFELDLPAGTYRVKATDDGYNDDWYQGASDYAGATDIAVADAPVDLGTFTMSLRTYTLQGTVTGGVPSKPLVGQTVVLWGFDTDQQPVATTTTDADGHYEFDDLSQISDAELHFVGGDGWAQVWYKDEYADYNATRFDVSSDMTIDQTMARTGTINGKVELAGTSKPVAGAVVSATTLDGNFVGSATTDSHGMYSIKGIPNGTFKIGAVGPDYADLGTQSVWVSSFYGGTPVFASGKNVTLRPDSAVSGINIGLHHDTKIEGFVFDKKNDVPVAYSEIDLTNSKGTVIQKTWVLDSTGRYEFDDVKPGTYRVHTVGAQSQDFVDLANDWYRSVSLTDSTPVVARAGETTKGVDFSLPHDGFVEGTVLHEPGVTPVMKVEIYTKAGAFVSSYQMYDGQWGVVEPTGDYRVHLVDEDGYYASAWYWDKSSEGTSTVIGVTADKHVPASHHQALGYQPLGTIHGKVELDGAPAAGATVTATRTGTTYYEEYTPQPATVSASGTFTITGVPAGSWNLTYSDNGANPVNYHDRYISQQSVHVTAGHSTSAETQLMYTSGQLSGTVTDANGPVSGANVDVYTLSGQWVGEANTGDDGTYTLGNLPPGKVKVQFWGGGQAGDPDGYNYPADGGTWLGGKTSFATSGEADTTSGDAADAVLSAADSVTTTVISAATHGAIDNADVWVWRKEPDGSWREITPDGYGDWTGHVALHGLAPGEYILRAIDQNYGLYASGYDGHSTTQAGAKPFVITGSSRTVAAPTIELDLKH